MKNYKVCILAAGIGSRSFDPNINKALLPLDGKAVLSNIIDKFDQKQKFVIALGYLEDQVKQYLMHAHPKTKFEFVTIKKYFGLGSGPGHSLLCCEQKLKCPFILTSADTVVLENISNPYENWMGVAPIKNTSDFCTVQTNGNFITRIDDKTLNDNRLAWIGLAGIKDYKYFFNCLKKNQKHTKNEIQISNGLKGLMAKSIKTENYTWYDTGSYENYKIAKETLEDISFDFSKPDEYIYKLEDKIIKFFIDNKKVSLLKKRWQKLKKITPKKLKFTKNFLSYEKFKGSTLYEVVNNSILNKLLIFLDKNLWNKITKKTSVKFNKDCFDFYKLKTLSRIDLFYKKNFFKDKKYKINGIERNNLSYYLKNIDWKYISKGIETNFHGDLQFDNIILDNNGKVFKLIDWRSDFNNQTEKGDLYYDLAKLYAGCMLPYSQIKKGNLNFAYENQEIIYDFPINNNLVDAKYEIENFVKKKNLDLKKIRIISSLIFLNMSPLHTEPFSHLLYFLGISKLAEALK